MKKIVAISFIVATILHFLVYKIFENKKILNNQLLEKVNGVKNSVSVTLIKLKSNKLNKQTKKSKKVKLIKNSKEKKLSNQKAIKKVVKKEKLKSKISKSINKKDVKKIIKKQKIIKKKIVKRNIKKPKIKIDPITKSYIDLYGKEFDKFDKETKIFILKNIKDIGLITQRYLEYPFLSAQAGQSGLNIVEFILYPDGHISELKIIKSSGYFMLDDNTVETIKLAYYDYPKPSKATLIRIFVKYVLK